MNIDELYLRLISYNLSLNNIKQSNPKLKESIEFQIDSLIYSNITGYNCNRKKHILFLDFYYKIKHDLSLKEFRVLYSNSKISDDRLVSVVISKPTKFDIIFKYFMSIMMFILSISIFILSSYISKESNYAKWIISIFFVISFLSSVFLMIENISMKHFLKKIKEKYDNYQI